MPHAQSRWLTTLFVAGRNIGTFMTFEGGHVTGESMPSRVPGAEFPRKGGGEKDLAPITIGRDYDPNIDTDELVAFLQNYVGAEDAAIVGRRPLDKDRNPYGTGRKWTGTITAIREPESDTNTTNDKAVLTIEIDPSGKS